MEGLVEEVRVDGTVEGRMAQGALLERGVVLGRRVTTAGRGLCALEDALAYRNEKVVRHVARTCGFREAEARALFLETKRWLWLVARSLVVPAAPRMTLPPHLWCLERVWASFVLHTREYERFCLQRLGHFIHYAPEHGPLGAVETPAEPEPVRAQPRRAAALGAQLAFTRSELGPGVVTHWHQELRARFGDEPPRARVP